MRVHHQIAKTTQNSITLPSLCEIKFHEKSGRRDKTPRENDTRRQVKKNAATGRSQHFFVLLGSSEKGLVPLGTEAADECVLKALIETHPKASAIADSTTAHLGLFIVFHYLLYFTKNRQD